MEPKVTSTTVKGLIISLVLITLTLAGQFIGFDDQSWYRWVALILLMVALIGSCVIYSNQNNNNVTFGNVFADGFKVTAVVTCITLLFTIVFYLAMPEMKQRTFEVAAKAAEEQGATDDMIAKQEELLKSMFWVFTIAGITLTYIVLGAIASLIGAAVAKKNPKTPFQQ